MGNVNMEASQINYRGGEKKMSVEEALKNTSGEAAAIAQLQEDVAGLNGSKANRVDIATEFSDLTNYNAGDLVYYEGDLYEFQVDHTAGSWETSEVIQKDLSDIITTLKSGLTDINSNITNKSNLKIVQKGTTSTSIVALYQETAACEEVTYNVNTNSNLSDYPSDLISVGAIYYPQVNIKKYNSEYGFIMIQAAVVDGTPKVIFGYYNNGTCQWGSVI